MNESGLDGLQERLGVRFKDTTYLQRALTHRSAATENSLDSNERLEFLGDSVVGLVAAELLFRRYPHYSEGDLAKSKAYVVSEPVLAEAALTLGLEEFLVMSVAEAASGGRRRRSLLSDAFEAVVAAIYLDCGIRAAGRVVRNALENAVRLVAVDLHRGDYKSAFQEIAQARVRITPIYRIVGEQGREHEKTFVAQAVLGDDVIAEGVGHSKKEAEQDAAQRALENMLRSEEERAEIASPEPGGGVQ